MTKSIGQLKQDCLDAVAEGDVYAAAYYAAAADAAYKLGQAALKKEKKDV